MKIIKLNLGKKSFQEKNELKCGGRLWISY